MENERTSHRLPLEGLKLIEAADEKSLGFVADRGFFDRGTTYVTNDAQTPEDIKVYRVGSKASGHILTSGMLPEPFYGRMTGLKLKDGESLSIWNASERK